MEDGRRRRRRRKSAQRETAPATKIDALTDDFLELVFLRLPLHRHLVYAACTCRRWRRVIAGDVGRFLLRFISLRGLSPAHFSGHYRVDERHRHPRPPGGNPVFVPSSSRWVAAAVARNLALDFLPPPGLAGRCWELADFSDGLLLLLLLDKETTWSPAYALVVCDPLTGSYSTVPLSAWFQGCGCLGAFLLHGEDAGARISLSNFRVTCAVYRPGDGVARACAFSSAGGGRWTSGAARSSMAVYGDQFESGRGLGPFHFAGSTYGFAYWTVGDGILLALDKKAAEFSSSVGLDKTKYAALEDKRHTAEYAYQSPWFRACLS
ncbi:uncharacterized protein LOC119272092 [Triticum dicoccoides]|uniref:uncharacterized protein LOC119272092 n=1 Tax=Triticum dicoccoides TaxID=85692 RepID=UPI00162E413F|nr:uncharacterized protein LOC119272092 [Triticum dicoccoides]